MATIINCGVLSVNGNDYSGNKTLQSKDFNTNYIIDGAKYGYMIPYADAGLDKPSASLSFVEATVIPTSGFTAVQFQYSKDDGFGKTMIVSATAAAFQTGLKDTTGWISVPVVTAEGFSKKSGN